MRMLCLLLVTLSCCSLGRFVSASDDAGQLLHKQNIVFFVQRDDTKEAVCFWRETDSNYTVLFHNGPVFDLDKLEFSPDVGIMQWNAINDWKILNHEQIQTANEGTIQIHQENLIAGDQRFHLVETFKNDREKHFFILASNITLWFEDTTSGRGLSLELDHWNETTKVKDSTVKHCDQNPENKHANCTILIYETGTNCLDSGNKWGWFGLLFKEYFTFFALWVNFLEGGNVIRKTWHDPPFIPFGGHSSLFAKSHQRNAAIATETASSELTNSIAIKRNYTHRNSEKFCLVVIWNVTSDNTPHEFLEVKNVVSGRVAPGIDCTHFRKQTFFKLNLLEAGEYEITLRFGKRKPRFIDLCDGNSWIIFPKKIQSCSFFHSGYSDHYTWVTSQSNTTDPTIIPNWELLQWANVCAWLGIGSNDTEVPIKFCNKFGCNFSKCPHLQDSPRNP